MELPLILIVIGIIVAAVVHSGLGIAMILIGLVLLLWPRIRTATPLTRPRGPDATGIHGR